MAGCASSIYPDNRVNTVMGFPVGRDVGPEDESRTLVGLAINLSFLRETREIPLVRMISRNELSLYGHLEEGSKVIYNLIQYPFSEEKTTRKDLHSEIVASARRHASREFELCVERKKT